MLFVLPLAMLALASPDSTETYKRQCTFNDFKHDIFYDGPCLETNLTDSAGNFTVVYRFKKLVVKIPFGQNQGPWTPVKINGEPGMRYEINRDHYDFSTLDVNHIQLEVN